MAFPVITFDLETLQNSKNNMAAARNKFFSRKIHKLKKILLPLFSRPRARFTKPDPLPQYCEDEELQNSMNEALETRLVEDLANSPGVSGDAICALEAGQLTLIVVNPGHTPVPSTFFSPAPGRFSWTFLPSPDHDICSRGDSNACSFSQIPEQQTPPPSPY